MNLEKLQEEGNSLTNLVVAFTGTKTKGDIPTFDEISQKIQEKKETAEFKDAFNKAIQEAADGTTRVAGESIDFSKLKKIIGVFLANGADPMEQHIVPDLDSKLYPQGSHFGYLAKHCAHVSIPGRDDRLDILKQIISSPKFDAKMETKEQNITFYGLWLQEEWFASQEKRLKDEGREVPEWDKENRAYYMKVAKTLVGAGWGKQFDKKNSHLAEDQRSEDLSSFVNKVRQEIQKDNANNARQIGIRANLIHGGNGGL